LESIIMRSESEIRAAAEQFAWFFHNQPGLGQDSATLHQTIGTLAGLDWVLGGRPCGVENPVAVLLRQIAATFPAPASAPRGAPGPTSAGVGAKRSEVEIREAADLLDRDVKSGRWRSRPESEQNVLVGGFCAMQWILQSDLRGGDTIVAELLRNIGIQRMGPERN
jgi:hypothetical protein